MNKTYSVNIAKDGQTFKQKMDFQRETSRQNLDDALKFAETYLHLFMHYPQIVLTVTCGDELVWTNRANFQFALCNPAVTYAHHD